MEYEDLIEEITRLVIQELEKSSDVNVSLQEDSLTREIAVLVDPEMTSFDEMFDVLGRITGKKLGYTLVLPGEKVELLKSSQTITSYRVITDPPRCDYSRIAAKADEVVIPYLSVTQLSKIANLIGDEMTCGIALQSLLLSKPVTICTDNVHSIKFTEATLSKKLLSMIGERLSILEQLGIRLVQLKSLGENIALEKSSPASPESGKKQVVTSEDVKVLSQQQIKELNLPRGSIVTALAQREAKKLGIRINIV